MSDPAAPRRVRVTGPRGGAPRRMSAASQIDAGTQVGRLYMRALIRSQLRLALAVTGVLAATLGLLPLLMHAGGWFHRTRVAGIPLDWLLLGGGVYPLLLGLAVFFVRRAERNEQAFAELVRHSTELPEDRAR